MGKVLYLAMRFKEASTWATITALLALVGYHLDSETVKTVVDGLILVSGILGVWISEGVPVTKVFDK